MITKLINKVYAEPWAITPNGHRAIRSAINNPLMGYEQIDGALMDNAPLFTRYSDNTAIVNISGTIGKRLSKLETMLLGGVDVDWISATVDEIAADDTVENVVFDFDSCGGTCCGVYEVANKIAELGKTKNTIGWTSTISASASYWMMAQCNHVYSSTSAEVGSIGVMMALMDETAAMEMDGLKVNEFASGKFKTSGAPWKELNDEERALFKADVDKWFGIFADAVLRKRQIDAQWMEGQTFDGEQAVITNLTDGIIDEFSEVLALTIHNG